MDSGFHSSDEVMTQIVLPTIIFCIGMVVAMLVGINKCKQWELDKIVEMRRTRRALQKMTNRLREKNFNTIQKARNMRKQATLERKTSGKYIAPPLYESIPAQPCGTSPPPTYEDALLDDYYYECHPSQASMPVPRSPRRFSRTSQASSSRHRNSRSMTQSRRQSTASRHKLLPV